VKSALPIVLFGLGGLLLGGVISMRQQGVGKLGQGLLGLFALLAVAGGVLWLIGEG
jgi:hypothetical protein